MPLSDEFNAIVERLLHEAFQRGFDAGQQAGYLKGIQDGIDSVPDATCPF